MADSKFYVWTWNNFCYTLYRVIHCHICSNLWSFSITESPLILIQHFINNSFFSSLYVVGNFSSNFDTPTILMQPTLGGENCAWNWEDGVPHSLLVFASSMLVLLDEYEGDAPYGLGGRHGRIRIKLNSRITHQICRKIWEIKKIWEVEIFKRNIRTLRRGVRILKEYWSFGKKHFLQNYDKRKHCDPFWER